jgi:cytochrome oxidase Cu insertion factor (SCO1/SenC/PrrC family)
MRRVAALLGTILVAVVSCSRPNEDDHFYPVGPFRLTERGGQTVTGNDLRGKVWVASFVFTRCTGPCPQVSGTVARLQHEFQDQPDVRLVTFTVDPERDDPAELSAYAEHFQADPQRWLFLTGKQDDVYRLLREGFRVPVEQNQGEARQPGSEVMHSPRLVVVDRHGWVRGYFDGVRSTLADDPEKEFQDSYRRLCDKVRALLREAP